MVGVARPRRHRPRSVLALQFLAVGVVLILGSGLALADVLRQSPRLAGTNNVRPDVFLATLQPGTQACQTDVVLPADTAGVRVRARTFGRLGPLLTVRVTSRDKKLVREGSVAGYADRSRPLLRFPPIRTTQPGFKICLSIREGTVTLAGQPDPDVDMSSRLLVQGKPVPADIALQYIRPGRESLLGIAPVIFHRASLFRPTWIGPWTYYVLVAFVPLLILVAVAILLVGSWRSVTLLQGTVAVALVAFLNAACWSVVTPAFQPPDEGPHYAYTESIVERGRAPADNLSEGGGSYTEGMALAVQFAALGVVQNDAGRPPWTDYREAQWKRANAVLGASAKDGGGGYTNVAAYSPFYYGLEAVPYLADRNGDFFTRLWLMRLLSALMAAGTATFSFLLAREVFPTVSWAGPVGGLAVALQPMFAFIGGAVNNDNLLFLFASAELYLLARALRRGLTLQLAVILGAVLGVGVAAKPTMLALVPAAAFVVGWCIWRTDASRRAFARLGVAAVLAFLLALGVRYALFPHDEAVAGVVQSKVQSKPFTVPDFLSYLWQWYLPRPPFIRDKFLGTIPVWDIYFKGFWGTFGHLETLFPEWVYRVVALVSVAVVGMLLAAIHRIRPPLARLAPWIGLVSLSILGFALLVNVRSYLALIQSDVQFAQGRYLVPLVPLVGVSLVGAGLALGPKRGIVVATALIALMGVFNLFSLGLVMTRFYS